MSASGGGEEKTEKATPKKRQDARKDGQVRKSTEVNTAVLVIALLATIQMFGPGMVDRLDALLVRYLYGHASSNLGLTVGRLQAIAVDIIGDILMILLPVFIVAMLIGVGVNLLQVGFLYTTKPLRPKFNKINPMSGFKRIFSMRSVVEMLKALLKVSVIFAVVYSEYMDRFEEFPNYMGYDPTIIALHIFNMCMTLACKAALALIVIGALDYLYQWFDYERNLKMTKQEVKEEYKMLEGDPQIKSKRREKQRQIATMRMMQAMPNADVVITNPTHYAVALRYDDKTDEAPILIAKGRDLIAKRIKDKAREHNIEIVENKPLAQALYFSVEVGRQIPEDLYVAVADILAYVYNLKHPQPPARTMPKPAPEQIRANAGM